MPDRVRLVDVAREAGVSPSVVSRVLSGSNELTVRDATRTRILETASRLRYRPHVGAVGLRRERVGVIGLLIPDLTNTVLARIVRGAVEEAEALDTTVFLLEDDDASTTTRRVVDLFRSGRLDGLIMASAEPGHPLIDELSATNVPHVFVNRGVARSARNVIMDEAKASDVAVGHLAALGHTNMWHVAGFTFLSTAHARARAFVKACAARDLAPGLVVEEAFTEAGGARAAEKFLKAPSRPSGVYTSSLRQAVGFISRLSRAGLAVPTDVSVVSYDDSPLANFTTPALTTVGMPLESLGKEAVTALLSQIDGGEPTSKTIPTQVELHERASTIPRARDTQEGARS